MLSYHDVTLDRTLVSSETSSMLVLRTVSSNARSTHRALFRLCMIRFKSREDHCCADFSSRNTNLRNSTPVQEHVKTRQRHVFDRSCFLFLFIIEHRGTVLFSCQSKLQCYLLIAQQYAEQIINVHPFQWDRHLEHNSLQLKEMTALEYTIDLKFPKSCLYVIELYTRP